MNKKVVFTVIYNRKGKLNRNGQALIQIEAYLNRKRKYFSTGIYIKPDQWDERRRIVKNHPDAQQLNLIILDQLQELQNFEMEMRKTKGYFELSMFDLLKQKDSINFWQMFDYYHDIQDVSPERKIYIRRTIRYLKEYNPKLSFSTFNLQAIYEFDAFLRNKKNLHVNTIMQHHKVVKHFFNVMIKIDIINDNPYKKFVIPREKTTRVYLTEEELQLLENINIKNNPHLQVIKDMFLFSCYTGLRFSDLQALKHQNIEKEDDKLIIALTQKKTKSRVRIPITLLFKGKAVEILERYQKTENRFIFPRMTNQEINRQLKIIQQLAGLDKRLTFHVARHTFGTLLAKYTHDPYVIKELMGHADIKTSMVYIHLSGRFVDERLKKVKW